MIHSHVYLSASIFVTYLSVVIQTVGSENLRVDELLKKTKQKKQLLLDSIFVMLRILSRVSASEASVPTCGELVIGQLRLVF